MYDQQMQIRMPAVDVATLKTHADKNIKLVKRGPRGRLAEWVRQAIIAQAQREKIKLEVLKNDKHKI